LTNIYSYRAPVIVSPHLRKVKPQELSGSPYPGYLSRAANSLIDTIIDSASCDRCITDLEQFSSESVVKCDPHKTSVAL